MPPEILPFQKQLMVFCLSVLYLYYDTIICPLFRFDNVNRGCPNSEKKIKKIVNDSIPNVTIKELSSDLQEKGFVLETADKKITYNSTVSELKSYLLENYRGELVKELFADSI